jgi:hypothetical protein
MKARAMLAGGSFCVLMSSLASGEPSVGGAAARRFSVQAQVELLPGGSSKDDLQEGGSRTTDSAVTYAIAGTFEYTPIRYVSVGVAPRLIFNAAGYPGGSEADDEKELDLRVRIRGHYPVTSGIDIYAAIMPGYSFMLPPDGDSTYDGFALGGAVGATYDLSSRVFVGGEVGYQRAYTRSVARTGVLEHVFKWDLSYPHIGIGAGVRW